MRRAKESENEKISVCLCLCVCWGGRGKGLDSRLSVTVKYVTENILISTFEGTFDFLGEDKAVMMPARRSTVAAHEAPLMPPNNGGR